MTRISTWVSIDANELVRAGVALRDSSQVLLGSRTRILQSCCSAGLGAAGPALSAGAGTAGGQIERLVEDYLRQGIAVVQRALLALQNQALPSLVPSVSGPTAAIVGGAFVGGGAGWSTVDASASLGSGIVGGSGWGWSASGGGYGGGQTVGGTWKLDGLSQLVAGRQNSGVTSGSLGSQMLANINNAAMTARLDNSQVLAAANSPVAGIVQFEKADAIDGGSRANTYYDNKFYETKRIENVHIDQKIETKRVESERIKKLY